MNVFYVIIIVLCILLANYINKNWKTWWYRNDPDFPKPLKKRNDLYVGFYGTQDAQVAETKDSFNLLVEAQMDGPDKCVQNILDAKVDTFLYVPGQVFSDNVPGQKHTVRSDAEVLLRAFFQKLRDAEALKYVKAICPIDEPNNTVANLDELTKGVNIVRQIANEFTELAGLKLATFFAADKPFMGQSLFDWVGYDDYDMRANLMLSKKYKEFVASLRTDQKVMLPPGAAYGHDPIPWMDFAQLDPKVVAVIAFLWLDERNNDVGAKGARSNGMGSIYLAVFKDALSL